MFSKFGSESLFGSWCPLQSENFIGSILLSEFLTHNPLYTAIIISCVFILVREKRGALVETWPFDTRRYQ
jgi:hypothetical protein